MDESLKKFLAYIILTIGSILVAIGTCDDKDKSQEQTLMQQQQAEMRAQQEAQMKRAEAEARFQQIAANFIGNYSYGWYLKGTNVEIYFKIGIQSNGRFTHGGANDTSRDYIEVSELVDGRSYPNGGSWYLIETPQGYGVGLHFDDSWGDATITPDKSVIEFSNMNGYRYKTRLYTSKGKLF